MDGVLNIYLMDCRTAALMLGYRIECVHGVGWRAEPLSQFETLTAAE